MKASEVREKYLKFFEKKGHKVIPSSSLVPENDPSTLFISAGMQPLVPYLLGETHPEGTRLVDVQKCIRTGDIDEVGDTYHHTFFEMLGNWSLGDYFKKESIPWSYEFLTKELGISRDKLSVTVFAGDEDAPRDTEAAEIWKSLGIPEERIYYFGKEDNWWAAGATGPCGPDTEIFYDVTEKAHGKDCKPGDGCGRYFEIWNNVFMVYNRKADGNLEELPKKNVDTGMGLDRTATVLSGLTDNYENDLFKPALEVLLKISSKEENYIKNPKPYRIVLDHLRASVFAIADGVEPSNKGRGYVLRRLIRRAMLNAKKLNLNEEKWFEELLPFIMKPYLSFYTDLSVKENRIREVLSLESNKFTKTLDKGLKEFNKLDEKHNHFTGLNAFNLYQTYGFPVEVIIELFREKGADIDESFLQQFEDAKKGHAELSKTTAAKFFKGGLADTSIETTKLHTATHLLHSSLRKILGVHVSQKGSNITAERLRFDFTNPNKLTDVEKKEVEDLINEQIKKSLPVSFKIMSLEEAEKEGALHFFNERYGEKVKVYTIGNPEGEWFSKEVCGGPHVENTSELGTFKIIKEEAASAGVRRIYATLE